MVSTADQNSDDIKNVCNALAAAMLQKARKTVGLVVNLEGGFDSPNFALTV